MDPPAAEEPEVLDDEIAQRVNECRDALPPLEREILIEMDVERRRAREVAERHREELITDEERCQIESGELDEATLLRQLERRVYRRRYAALDFMRVCLERKCRDGLTAAERRICEIVIDGKMSVARAAEEMSEDLADPGDGALDAEAAKSARLGRAERVIASARQKVKNCMESY